MDVFQTEEMDVSVAVYAQSKSFCGHLYRSSGVESVFDAHLDKNMCIFSDLVGGTARNPKLKSRCKCKKKASKKHLIVLWHWENACHVEAYSLLYSVMPFSAVKRYDFYIYGVKLTETCYFSVSSKGFSRHLLRTVFAPTES